MKRDGLKIGNQKEQVLTKAILKLADAYGLSRKDIQSIIGISKSTVTRIKKGTTWISPATKKGELALLLLRVYRGLNSLVGNNHEKAKLWLNSYNTSFNQKPIAALKTVIGLVQVLDYLDNIEPKKPLFDIDPSTNPDIYYITPWATVNKDKEMKFS